MSNNVLIKIVPGERFTPWSLARSLDARMLLESSSLEKGKERYSLLLVREAFHLLQDSRGLIFRRDGEDRLYRVGSAARDILDLCRYFADQHSPVKQDFPFPAGGVGFLSYEFARHCDTIKLADQDDPLGLPEAHFIFGHSFIVFDHYTDMLILIGLNYREASIDLETELSVLENRIAKASPAPEESLHYDCTVSSDPKLEAIFKENVATVQREIVAGNLLQAVPSRRLWLRTKLPAIEAYRQLRRNNPSPYLFYANFGSYELFGASPETHVKVKNGIATMHPIAGTRRRGSDQREDSAHEADLLADPKERAEHLMLVDLARNDLGRVSAPGTVKVVRYMSVERYSHVMHMVSEVRGSLAAGKTGIDAFRATFPSGTVSGAPKIRAMEILSRLEHERRGFYAGALGYIEPGGSLDTCIMIRCALKQGDTLVLQAGAGVVQDSTPERELEETGEKLGALLAAVNPRSKDGTQ